VSLSPDGLSIVYGSWDETVRVRDVSTGEVKAKREGHGAMVASVTFSPDGLGIVSGSKTGPCVCGMCQRARRRPSWRATVIK
jgi:WD40 repeat protein